MAAKRKHHTATFNAQVALAAYKGIAPSTNWSVTTASTRR